ncbi:resolvase [Micromonospora terminaliae]|uniref:Resolvase n=1 Tax=Micromonospora terminaliae TaxID=1914461 RepID=A0AAJ2ZBC5_9ACTN|nr:resolvase [Micromonospora terminaliae]NES26580.1 resolvase [Micromonospora terminaliae]QGL50747.1 resolvase [Micromonospora terminaliae]
MSDDRTARRRNLRDDLQRAAHRLREEGRTVNEIADGLGIAKSTAYRWVGHLPLDRSSAAAVERRHIADARRTVHRTERRKLREEVEREARKQGAEWVGAPALRELLLVGAVLYWCEGTKSKPANPRYDLTFTNSDIRLVELFVRFVEATGRSRQELRYRVSIHETADADAAGRWWAAQLGVDSDSFQRPTLKRHNPRTARTNVGADYRGCLVVRVPRSRELYLWMAGVVEGLVALHAPDPSHREVDNRR